MLTFFVTFRTAGFHGFLKYVLVINPKRRPTAQQLLEVSHASLCVLPDVIIDGQVAKVNKYYFSFNHHERYQYCVDTVVVCSTRSCRAT